eukprot:jgi/Undpi1/6729/HiC_scaffold_20.g09208.m1
MTVICLGPCCIPVSAFLPLLLIFISPILSLLRKTPLAKYLPNADAKSTSGKGCCSDAACEGEGQGPRNVKTVDSIEEWEDLKRSTPLLIVDFTAAWCGPCRKIGPVFERLATEHAELASFVKVDIDDLPDAFTGISIPAFHVFQKGQKIDSVNGAMEQKLRELVAKHCQKGGSLDSSPGKTTKVS